jgi:hypothetical protein
LKVLVHDQFAIFATHDSPDRMRDFEDAAERMCDLAACPPRIIARFAAVWPFTRSLARTGLRPFRPHRADR